MKIFYINFIVLFSLCSGSVKVFVKVHHADRSLMLLGSYFFISFCPSSSLVLFCAFSCGRLSFPAFFLLILSFPAFCRRSFFLFMPFPGQVFFSCLFLGHPFLSSFPVVILSIPASFVSFFSLHFPLVIIFLSTFPGVILRFSFLPCVGWAMLLSLSFLISFDLYTFNLAFNS